MAKTAAENMQDRVAKRLESESAHDEEMSSAAIWIPLLMPLFEYLISQITRCGEDRSEAELRERMNEEDIYGRATLSKAIRHSCRECDTRLSRHDRDRLKRAMWDELDAETTTEVVGFGGMI